MNSRLTFNLTLLAVAGYFVWSAAGYEPPARRIPIMIGVLVLVLQLWVTIREYLGPQVSSAAQGFPADERRRVAAMGGWMALFFVLLAGVGTLIGTVAFVFMFLAAGRKAPWRFALSMAAALSGAIWLLFAQLMRFELYPGMLFNGTLPPL